ncbi:MAG: pyrroline-5-carboxylate reductase [Candidatus Omnitrophica bacterium]|nr:pyrroline-5-carboxylate reductase [Candidatus Omnitrophota bacterium]
MRRKRIGVVGAGNMGQALIKGLRTSGLSAEKIRAVESNPYAARLVRTRYGVRSARLQELPSWADIMILAVKPQDLQPVVTEIGRRLSRLRKQPLSGGGSRVKGKGVERSTDGGQTSPFTLHLSPFTQTGVFQQPASVPSRRCLIVSIAAGVPLAALERSLQGAPIVRVMPNLGAKVGQGISALAYGRAVTPSDKRIARGIFGCVGEVLELPERLFHLVTAISGSGPAYFFLIFQALRDAGVRGGLSRAAATRLAVQTALGSAQVAGQTHDDLDVLVAQVASKRGTTEAALQVLRERGLTTILGDAIAAAAKRSAELAELFRRL